MSAGPETVKNVFRETKAYIAALLAALVAVAWVLLLGSRPVSDDPQPVRVVIVRGASASRIADLLDQKRLIRSSFVFKLSCRISGAGDKLKPGVYEFNRSMSLPQIIRRLQDGRSLETWVTIPEGYNAYQIAVLLESRELARSDAFLRLAITQGYQFPSYTSVYGHNLEGYLFPDTYLVSRGTGPEAIIRKMLDAFEAKVVRARREELEEAVEDRFGLTDDRFPEGLHKLLTVASVVEREARIERDRSLIAAVIWNRLAKGMKLEVDATVTYIPGQSGENKARVFYKDLENDSPYNTYRRYGLPPGPICNPGIASILAAMNPAPVDYLFYVARKDGSHIFSRTHEEHLAAVRRVRSEGQ